MYEQQIYRMSKRNEIKREYSEYTKLVLRTDIGLALKIVKALNREMGIYAYLALVKRNSRLLKKPQIIKIISEHMNVGADQLFDNNNKISE